MHAILGLILGAALAPVGDAQSGSGKPAVPPGRDPGGVAVALIGAGADYTVGSIAARLARDGEGEIAGWDFLDRDRRPFARCTRAGEQPASVACRRSPAAVIADAAPAARLVVLEASGAQPRTVVAALAFVARSPARIVLFTHDAAIPDSLASASHSPSSSPTPAPTAFLYEAAQRHPTLLLIAPAPRQARPAPGPATLLLVASAGDAGSSTADVAVAGSFGGDVEAGATATADASANHEARSDLAAARVAALAARLSAAEPALDAGGLKRRILAMATPSTRNAGARPLIIDTPELPASSPAAADGENHARRRKRH